MDKLRCRQMPEGPEKYPYIGILCRKFMENNNNIFLHIYLWNDKHKKYNTGQIEF